MHTIPKPQINEALCVYDCCVINEEAEGEAVEVVLIEKYLKNINSESKVVGFPRNLVVPPTINVKHAPDGLLLVDRTIY